MGQTHLTERQEEILSYIVDFIRDNLMPPTLREVGKRFGIGSTNGVVDHLKTLERKGYIRRQDGAQSRGIKLTQKARDKYNLWFVSQAPSGYRKYRLLQEAVTMLDGSLYRTVLPKGTVVMADLHGKEDEQVSENTGG